MALTDSNMLPLGTTAPSFSLVNILNGEEVCVPDNDQYAGTVIIFMCNHCPYVIHLIDHIAQLAAKYASKGFRFIGINSNDIERYPDDRPELMKEFAEQHQIEFPYCFDSTQQVARDYDAACTPDFYVFDRNLKLVYRGRYDDSRPGNQIRPSGDDLAFALDCLKDNEEIPELQYPSAGCNIKWKS